jgi:hypothetical protein
LEGQHEETEGASKDIEEVYYEELNLYGGVEAWTTPLPMVSAKDTRRRPTIRIVV